MQKLRERLTYANVAATLALVIAVAGGTTAIAAKVIAPKNSVVSKSIRNGNVTARDLAEPRATTQRTTLAAGETGSVTATCAQGGRAIGGSNGGGASVRVSGSGMSGPANAWFVTATNESVGSPAEISATVWCLPAKP